MKSLFVLLCALLGALCVHAQTSTFTYQGRLQADGGPAQGIYDFQFILCDSATNVSGLGINIVAGTSVSNGLFTVTLGFGPDVWSGGSGRWLEIAVRTNGAVNFTTLSPRQLVTASPFAVVSGKAVSADSAASVGPGGVSLTSFGSNVFTTTNLVGQISDAQLSLNVAKLIGGTLPDANLSSNVARLDSIYGWELVNDPLVQARPNGRYLVVNGSQPTIQLPLAPNLGDTIRVSSLASANGWKIAQTNGQTILGTALNLMVWKARESVRNWQSVACSIDGNIAIACANGGNLFISQDGGTTWTARDTTRAWKAVACSGDGTKMFAVVNGGLIYTSTDRGTNWLARDSVRSWTSIACSSDGVRVVAGTTGFLYTSANSGTNWTQRATSLAWGSVTASSDGHRMVAVPSGNQIYTSTDYGTNWVTRDSSRGWTSVSGVADLTQVAASTYNGAIYVSSDSGVTWFPSSSGFKSWLAVACQAYGSTILGAASQYPLHLSSDFGATWKACGPTQDWTGVACSSSADRFYAVGLNAQIYVSDSVTSPNTTVGASGYLIGERYAAIELQYVGGGMFQPLSHEGTISGH